MKRVLIVAYDFPPRGGSGVFRVAKFVRYLHTYGWLPVVVTVAGEGPHPDHRLLAELPDDIEVLRVGRERRDGAERPISPNVASSSVAGWRAKLKPWIVPDPQLVWVPGALRTAARRLRRGDVEAVLTSGPPFSTHLVGAMLKRRYPALPWVMDMRDLWSEGFDQHALVPYKLNRWLEQQCVRRADHVTVVTDGMGRLMVRTLGAQPDKVTTITNGFDQEDIAPFADMRRRLSASTTRPLRLAYVGTITEGQVGGVASLFAALTQLEREGMGAEQIQLQLVGSFGPAIHQRARPLMEQGVVELMPFKPHLEAIACMMEADVLLLVRPDDLDGRIVHTSKIFEYMATGRPILAIAPQGEITRLVQQEHLGWSATPNDVEDIVAVLRSMLAEHHKGTLAAPTLNPDRLGRWERRVLTGQLATLLDRLVEGER